jgi:hypothetical protein
MRPRSFLYVRHGLPLETASDNAAAALYAQDMLSVGTDELYCRLRFAIYVDTRNENDTHPSALGPSVTSIAPSCLLTVLAGPVSEPSEQWLCLDHSTRGMQWHRSLSAQRCTRRPVIRTMEAWKVKEWIQDCSEIVANGHLS